MLDELHYMFIDDVAIDITNPYLLVYQQLNFHSFLPTPLAVRQCYGF